MDRSGGICGACGARSDDDPEQYRRGLWAALRAFEAHAGMLRWEITSPNKRSQLGDAVVSRKEQAIAEVDALATMLRERLEGLA